MKKKTVSIMVAATMALSLFAGCGSSKDTATEDTSKTESTETTDESIENASEIGRASCRERVSSPV